MHRIPSTFVVLALLSPIAASAEQVLPADVLAFTLERESCDHWRGETPYDSEREIEINAGICGSCIGTDEKLDALKAKYKQRSNVVTALNEFEPKIEALKGARAAKFCKAAYKKYFELQEKYKSKEAQ